MAWFMKQRLYAPSGLWPSYASTVVQSLLFLLCVLLTIPLLPQVSRESIDAVKNYFREDLQKSDWQLFIELKKLFHII